MRPLPGALALVALLLLGPVAAADDGPALRLTTPRAELVRDGGRYLLGVPAGRAWGVESGLMPVPRRGAAVRLTIEVADAGVREAFVRVAWYERAVGRPRQVAVDDSPLVRLGPAETLEVTLDPPEGAVAWRVRVLLRVRPDLARSVAGGARFTAPELEVGGPSYTRLLPAAP